MASDRRRDPSEPFIEDNHRFPPDERRREKRPAPRSRTPAAAGPSRSAAGTPSFNISPSCS